MGSVGRGMGGGGVVSDQPSQAQASPAQAQPRGGICKGRDDFFDTCAWYLQGEPAILNYMQKHLILQALRTQLMSWALKLVGLLRLGQGVTAAQALRLVSSCHQRGDVQAL
jgi:hypothetical protein